eukprot:scaffold114039_cov74-Cyclotella_meneghiniana.AAC.1
MDEDGVMLVVPNSPQSATPPRPMTVVVCCLMEAVLIVVDLLGDEAEGPGREVVDGWLVAGGWWLRVVAGGFGCRLVALVVDALGGWL